MLPSNHKQHESERLSAQVKEFLGRGGKIKVISSHDQKPVSLPFNHAKRIPSAGSI